MYKLWQISGVHFVYSYKGTQLRYQVLVFRLSQPPNIDNLDTSASRVTFNQPEKYDCSWRWVTASHKQVLYVFKFVIFVCIYFELSWFWLGLFIPTSNVDQRHNLQLVKSLPIMTCVIMYWFQFQVLSLECFQLSGMRHFYHFSIKFDVHRDTYRTFQHFYRV